MMGPPRLKAFESQIQGFRRSCRVLVIAALAFQASCATPNELGRTPTAGTPSGGTIPGGTTPAGPALDVRLSSGEVVDGSVLLVTAFVPASVSNRGPGSANFAPQGEFEGTVFPFYEMRPLGAGVYQALVGIPHSHATGPAHLVVRHGNVSARAEFVIKDAGYRSEVLRVQERKVNPLARDLIRIRREQKEIGEAYSRTAAEKLWDGPFLLPVDSLITSAYGTKRLYNGQLKSFHSGVDLRAPVGTPIRAPASGVVLLAKDLFFTGKTVIVDHGHGLITLYAHMSRIRVKKGQRVAPRQLLGLAGQTGRVSGPHLHWMAMIHRVKVDPMELVKVLHQESAGGSKR